MKLKKVTAKVDAKDVEKLKKYHVNISAVIRQAIKDMAKSLP